MRNSFGAELGIKRVGDGCKEGVPPCGSFKPLIPHNSLSPSFPFPFSNGSKKTNKPAPKSPS